MSGDGAQLVVTIAAVVVGLGLTVWAKTRENEREEVWRAHAARRGGRFTPSGGMFSSTQVSMEIESGGVPVLVDTYVVSNGKTSSVFTRARAQVALDGGPVFSVYREGLFSSLGKALGAQDVELGGHPRFDEVFMVKCDAPAAVRGVWTRTLRSMMCERLERARAISDGTTVTLVLGGVVDDTAVLDALVEVAGGLAGQGLAQLADLATLAVARYVPPTGPWDARSRPRLELDARGVTVTLDARGSNEGIRVELSARAPRELPTLAASIDASGAVSGEAPAGLLPSKQELARLGGAKLSASGTAIRIRFAPGRFPGPAHVEAAVELIAALTRTPESAFR